MKNDWWWWIGLTLPWIQAAARQEVPQTDLQRAREHYAAVERELCAREVSHLTEAQRAARAALIETLDAYRERGDFTRNTDFPGARVPYFRDGAGRLCAVATLLHATGEDELVQSVVASNNHVWVSELAADERFASWLARVGLSFDEAVRIQGPANGGVGDPDGPPPSPPTPSAPSPWGGPGDGPGPSTPGTAPATPRGGAGPATLPGGALSPGTLAGGLATPSTGPNDLGAGLDDWIQWWELNKLRWFEPELRARALPSDDRTRAESDSSRMRRTFAPRILSELSHAQAEVRSAAAFAYARAAGAAAVPALQGLFTDPSREVRDSAILALGVTGAEEGVHALLTLLRSERPPSLQAKPLAIVALGVARMHGRGLGTDVILSQLLETLERERGDDVVHAVMLFQSLAPSTELATRVRCASQRFREDCEHDRPRPETRARAIETLRFDADPSTVLPRLLDAVHGREVDERRSAASALAEIEGALDPLLTAFELEAEPVTRGRLLISIGERGDERARGFLAERLERGRKSDRPWAALALGLLAGEDWDERAREELHAAHARAGKSERDALLLAMGLARDEKAHDLLVETLASSRSDRTRMFAAVALGLIGAQEGRAVLAAAIDDVSCPFARSGMALALALYGDPSDAPRLMELLWSERRPESLRDLALALGMQGSRETALSLLALLEQDPPVAVRSAALDALGLALSDEPVLALATLARASNHVSWPEWVRGLLQHPL